MEHRRDGVEHGRRVHTWRVGVKTGGSVDAEGDIKFGIIGEVFDGILGP